MGAPQKIGSTKCDRCYLRKRKLWLIDFENCHITEENRLLTVSF